MKTMIQMAGLCAGALALLTAHARAQTPGGIGSPFKPLPMQTQPGSLPLYPAGAPALPDGATTENWAQAPVERLVRNVVSPTVTPYLPKPGTATGAAVVVAPGGGFMLLSWDNEGTRVAQWFADHGVAAFLLKYRLIPTPSDETEFARFGAARMGAAMKGEGGPTKAPMFQPAIDDGIAAIRFVRAGAAKWRVDPHRVGMIGFSAGAMNTLGTTLANQPGAEPDFIGLIYGPMQPVDVPAEAPPLFAALAADDPLFARAGFGIIDSWHKAGRKAELHVYQQAGHGFGMLQNGTTTTLWPEEFLAWLKMNKFLGK